MPPTSRMLTRSSGVLYNQPQENLTLETTAWTTIDNVLTTSTVVERIQVARICRLII